ncbi:Fanconi anemia group C protein isoform X1 [Astyanax mexicanus]|uniref:Fanconi anemia group C protein isoform X1 n=1 Tax=Astyanax mexicanus TaxID=7994 RepID=UPI0020CB33AA|nr:Fanconi anemia group C protein isoform X1 [Astyanax mexicanus]
MAVIPELQVSFWMDKAVTWGQATSLSARLDTTKHLNSLRSFLQQLLEKLQSMSSTAEAMKNLPFVGQFLGRLCWNPYVTADGKFMTLLLAGGESSRLLLQCVWHLYSVNPQNAVERRANEWIQNLLYHLTSEEEGSVGHALEKHSGSLNQHYYSETLKKMVALLTEEVSMNRISSTPFTERCSCNRLRAVSVACVPLVTCPLVAPLTGALLKHQVSCGCSHLSEEFIEAVSTAWLSKKLVIEDLAVIALWCHSLSSLERAVLSLLESVLSDQGSVMQSLEKTVTDSLLPKASALHCHLSLLVNDVFRNVLMTMEENLAVRSLIQVFTACFLQIRTDQNPEERPPLKAFFPHVPQSLLTPLLTTPSEVPKQAWLQHLCWIRELVQEILCERNGEEEGKEKEEEEKSRRQRRAVFETWFLLVQCGHWVDAAAELLVSVGSEESEPLLFLLTFYHHPTNRGHQNTQQTMVAREAWSHLRILFLTHTPPPEKLSPVQELLSSMFSTNLVLHLLLNFAVFSQASASSVSEVIQKLLMEAGMRRKAAWILSSVQHRLNRADLLDARVHSRLKTLQDSLAPANAPGCT